MTDPATTPFTMQLTVGGDDLPPDDILLQARALTGLLEQALPDAEVRPVHAEAAAGTKGDPVTLGALAVTFFTSGAAVALIGCLKALFARNNALVVTVRRPDGTRLDIHAKNIGDEAIHEALRLAGRKAGHG